MVKNEKKSNLTNEGNILLNLLIKIIILIVIVAISIHIGIKIGAEKKDSSVIISKQDLNNEINIPENLDFNVEEQTEIILDKTNATQVSELIGQFIENGNKKAIDQYENIIVIPEGFRIVPNGQNDVKYGDYTGNSSNPSVQEGIVIEDREGNQFVWIPVGEINNKDGSTNMIGLARYVFDVEYNNETNEVVRNRRHIKYNSRNIYSRKLLC